MNAGAKADASFQVVTRNRKALHDYFILERYEAGLALLGTEVKSLREGGINLKDSYAELRGSEVYLVGCHISPYSHGGHSNHLPERERKLLLHRREIKKLLGRISEKGLTLVPLAVYFKRGKAKLELGLAKGKKMFDKRETVRKREMEREMRAGR